MLGQYNARRTPRRGCWGVYLALLLFAASFARGEPLFPPNCTVVLLSGLPGDLESETSYQEQTRSWLDILGSARPAKVFVLSDNPETVALPGSLRGQSLKADRAHFLELKSALGGISGPLTVIAWGHAGRQGDAPVFHVRGPRLTADDFKTLAEASPAAPARWVLLFRGSGAFARALAAPKREVLSSDCENAFGSDPIGGAVLLKAARRAPTVPFKELAEQFGRATAAWYTERNLARTEEPALWLGQDQPRLLAGSSQPVGASPTKTVKQDRSQANANAVDAAQSPAKKDPVREARDTLPVVWEKLKRVQPRDYPGAEAVVLQQALFCTIGSNPALETEQEEFIQILTHEGKQFGDFDISFSPPLEEIEILDCEICSPQGELTRLDPDEIGEAREQAPAEYAAGRRKFFSLPGVVPGAVLHVNFRKRWQRFPLPHISLELPLGRETPVVHSRIEVKVPRDSAFHFAFAEISAADPVIEQSTYGTRYSWRLDNLPAYQREILAAPRQTPRLMFSTFPDWRAFADWYGRISKLTDEMTPEIAARAKELTAAAGSDRDKIAALYNYVAALRYVAVPLGVNSVRPHAAAKVLANGFGDCKDKANLFNTLLHALNFKADLVLVPRFGEAYDGLPGLAFNHAISRVTLGRETLWVDTTDDICRFGLLPPGDPGRKVLVVDGQSATLTQLPAPSASEHRLELEGRITCANPAEPLPAHLSAKAFGYSDYELRSLAQATAEHQSGLPLLAAKFRPAAGGFALESQSATAVGALTENFCWQGQGSCIGLLSPADNRNGAGAQLRLHSPFWLPREWDQALHHRRTPLFLNQGYPLALQERFEVSLPVGADAPALPRVCANDQGPLRWRVEWSRPNPGKVVAILRAELATGELSASDSRLFQQQAVSLLAGMGEDATLLLRH